MNERLSKIIKVAACILLLGQTGARHAPPKSPKRRPTQADVGQIELRVDYGDKATVFRVVPTPSGGTLAYSSGAEPPRSRAMPAKDFNYLRQRLAAVKGESNDPRLCPRATITLTQGTRHLLGCLLAPNPVAKQLRDIVNLLSLYI